MTDRDESQGVEIKERLRQEIKALCELPGVAGHEQEVVRYLTDALRPLSDEVTVDRFGTILRAALRESRASPTDARRPLRPDRLCRPADRAGRFHPIRANGDHHGHDPPRPEDPREGRVGVIGFRPPHLKTAGGAPLPAEAPPLRSLYIDVGARSDEEVRRLGIRVGDPICFEPDCFEMGMATSSAEPPSTTGVPAPCSSNSSATFVNTSCPARCTAWSRSRRKSCCEARTSPPTMWIRISPWPWRSP